MSICLPTVYQNYIHQSRYARFRDDVKRRESWSETVERYITFFKKKFPTQEIPWDDLYQAILNLEVVPSMRALMSAGPALEKDNIAGYNCSFLPIDSVKAFDEVMFILMCGTGVGFSVESRYVKKLPDVPEELHPTDTTIIFHDSKLGWAKGFREFLSLLWSGLIPKWDVSNLRPAGARLKTFGGRASGPEPLVDLMEFAIRIFKGAGGRKLTTLECHDLVCKVADIVVSGGVRRSALISLSDLNDDHLRHAKSGKWEMENGQRFLANNSAVYETKPPMSIFLDEFVALYKSRSGERGIFSRKASQIQAAKYERRSADVEYGTNPCVPDDVMVSTDVGMRSVASLINKPFNVIRNGITYPSKGFYKTGTKDVYKVKTLRGYEFRATDNHKILTDMGWVELADLNVGDTLIINNTRRKIPKHDVELFDKGWILGEVVGDGCFNPEKYKGLVRFWGKTAKDMANKAFHIVEKIPTTYHQPIKPTAPTFNKINNTYQVCSRKIDELCCGLIDQDKNILPNLEMQPLSVIAGFLRGLFDADSSISGDPKTSGISIQLAQSNEQRMLAIQRMLLQFGIVSTLYHRNSGGYQYRDNKQGGETLYYHQPGFRLDIGRDNIELFAKYIGYYEPEKQCRLEEAIAKRSRSPYQTKFETQIVSIDLDGHEDVYDCTVPNIDSFDANGIVVHNCSEIILQPNQFCNLTEAILRKDENISTLMRKVELATILGTLQSTLTNFRYISKKWKTTTESERLLGVSLTGICDNQFMSTPSDGLAKTLTQLRLHAVETNKKFAAILGIDPSAAITCVKPSGTVSQLVDSASGIHPRYSNYYIRRVRMDKKDPLADYMIAHGYKAEEDYYSKSNWVFSFPQKAPENGLTTKDFTAIKQLELWKIYQDHWCEHKPSITVHVGEEEWLEVGAWVYKNLDSISGIAFLPRDTGSYRQAPYEEITKEKYDELVNQTKPEIDWAGLIEETDNTIGAQELACNGSSCELP